MNRTNRLARAAASLEGLALGDAFGDRLFFDNYSFQRSPDEEPFADRRLPGGRWEYTDDTQMALSVVEVLASHGRIDLDDYVAALWRTADGLGDIDTNCAIVGGIVAARVGLAALPADWLARCEPLPGWGSGEEQWTDSIARTSGPGCG